MYSWIAARETKVGGSHPTSEGVKGLLSIIDDDEEWYPGKRTYETKPRPKPVLRGPKLSALCRWAMAHNKRLGDVSYKDMVATCGDALLNPDTVEVVDKKRVYAAFKKGCDDEDPERP